jgi:hypothetical protein
MWQRVWEGFTGQNVFTFFIAVFTAGLWWTSCKQWQSIQQQLEVAERPFVVPSKYIFDGCRRKNPLVLLGNYGHKPTRARSWSGQTVDAKPLPKGPPLTKQQSIKIVPPDPQGERIDFDEFETVPLGSSCYLSGLIEYQFLGHRYCTRFCRYVTPPDVTEYACTNPLMNDFKEDNDCDQYETELPKPVS